MTDWISRTIRARFDSSTSPRRPVNRLCRLLPTVLASSLGLLLLVAAPPVFGQAAEKYKQQIQEYSRQLDQFAEKDQWGATTEDRKRARTVLEEARKLLAQGDTGKAGWLVKQAGDLVKLVEARFQAAKLEETAEEQEKKYKRHKEEVIPKLEEEIQELKEEQKELEEKKQKLESS